MSELGSLLGKAQLFLHVAQPVLAFVTDVQINIGVIYFYFKILQGCRLVMPHKCLTRICTKRAFLVFSF